MKTSASRNEAFDRAPEKTTTATTMMLIANRPRAPNLSQSGLSPNIP